MSGAPAAKKSLSAEPRASAAFQGIPCESCVYPGYSGVGGLLFHWQQKRRKRATKTPAASVYLLEKSALSAIFCCGFGAGKYYLK